jgi:hypothetical protein
MRRNGCDAKTTSDLRLTYSGPREPLILTPGLLTFARNGVRMREVTLKTFEREVQAWPTFWEAVRQNQRSPRSARARETSEHIAGKTPESACWDEGQSALLLSEGCGLHYSIEHQEVVWTLISASEFEVFRSAWTSDPEPIRLTRECHDGRLFVSTMDRATIWARIIGKTVRRIVTNEFGVYLHFEGDPRHLKFSAQVNANGNVPLLEWFEDED